MLEQTGVTPIQKAVFVLNQMSGDEKTQELARLREKALHDETSNLNRARREGIEIAKEKMRKNGMSENEINKIMGE